MTSRSQITLERELQRRARKRAAELGISFAEYVRRLIAQDLGEGQKKIDPSAVFNLGTSNGSDVARHKDAMIEEAFGAERHRESG